MRKRIWRVARRVTVGLVALGLGLSLAAAPTGAEGNGRQLVVTRLPLLDGTVRGTAADVNNHGQIVGTVYEAAEEGETPVGHPVLWEHGRVVPLAPNAGRGSASFINDRGDVALTVDGHAAIWRRGRLIDIDGDDAEAAWSRVDAFNERGDAIVARENADGWQTVVLWREGTIVKFASPVGAEAVAFPMALSDGGHVGVESRILEPDCGFAAQCPAHLWQRGSYTEFPPGQWTVVRGNVINRFGQVVSYLVRGETAVGAIRDRRGAVVSTFACPDGTTEEAPSIGSINDRGQVAGECTVSDSETLRRDPILWDRGAAHRLPSLGGWTRVNDINERGELLGHSGSRPFDESDSRLVLWSRGEMFVLAPTETANALALNDRGQVTGQIEGQPVIWELRAGRP
jgi:uncharacterized membrane protein